MTTDVVVEVGVAAVDDRVARLQVLEQLLDLGLGGVARRDHDPHRPRLLELLDELLDGVGRHGALSLGLDLRRLLGRPVVDHDLVTVADEPADHVGAHPTETDEPDAHGRHPSVVLASAAFECALQGGEARIGVGAEMDPQDGPAVGGDRRVVAVGLRVDELAEGVRPAGDVAVGRVVGGELEEPARRGAALVELAGRVEEARPVASGRGAAGRVAEPPADAGHRDVAGLGWSDERLEGEVSPGRTLGEVLAEAVGEGGVVEGDRGNGRCGRPSALGSLEEIASELLRLLDVWLVERVDAEDDPGDGGGDLPADELAAQVDRVGDRDADHRVAAPQERVGQGVAAAVRAAVEGEAYEDPVCVVGLGRADRFEVDRHDPDAVLAGALGDELFRPRPERGDLVIGQEGQLVAAGRGEGPEGDPERQPGVGVRLGLPTRAEHGRARREQRVEIDPDQRGRDEADVGQRAVPTADVGRVEEHLPELVVMGDRLEALAGVGDRDDERARLLPPVMADRLERLHGAIPGRSEERVGLDGRARFARDDDQRLERVEVVEHGRDGFGVGGVEDPEGEVALGRAKGPIQDVRCQAAATHPGDDRRREPGIDDRVAEGLEGGHVVGEVDRRVEPAETLRDRHGDRRIVGPERRVAREQPVRPFVVARPVNGRPIRGLGLTEREGRDLDGGRDGIGHRCLRRFSGGRSWYCPHTQRTCVTLQPMRRRNRVAGLLWASVVLGCSPAPSPTPPLTPPPVPADVVAWPDIVWSPADGVDADDPGEGEQVVAVASGPDGFVAVGYRDEGGDRDGLAWHSPDGEAWTRVGRAGVFGHVDLIDVAPAPAGFVAVGVGTLGAAADRPHVVFFTSPDGRSWQRLGDVPGSADTYPGSLVGGAHEVFAVAGHAGGDSKAWRSRDGRSFEEVFLQLPPGADLVAPEAVDDGYIGLASSEASPTLLRSSDGRTWTETPIDGATDVTANRVIAGRWGIVVQGVWAEGCTVMASCAGQGLAWWSGDGTGWGRLPGGEGSPVSSGASIIIAGGDHGLLALDGGSAWASPNGWAWRPLPEPGDGAMVVTDAVVAGDMIVAVGAVYGDDGTSHAAIVVAKPTG